MSTATLPPPPHAVTLTVGVPRYFDAADTTYYIISVRAHCGAEMLVFEAHRRFSGFAALHETIYQLYADTLPRSFPVRKMLLRNDESVKRRRAAELERYLCSVLRSPRPLPHEVLSFLGVPPLGVVASTLGYRKVGEASPTASCSSTTPESVETPALPGGGGGGDDAVAEEAGAAAAPTAEETQEWIARIAREARVDAGAPADAAAAAHGDDCGRTAADAAAAVPAGGGGVAGSASWTSWLAGAPTDVAIASAVLAPLRGGGDDDDDAIAARSLAPFLRRLRRGGEQRGRAAVRSLLAARGEALLDDLADAMWAAVDGCSDAPAEQRHRFQLLLTAADAAGLLRHAAAAPSVPLARALLVAGVEATGRVEGDGGATSTHDAAATPVAAGAARSAAAPPTPAVRFAGGSVECGGTTAVMAASAAGHVDVLRLLLRAGADADAIDAHGERALHAACRAGHAPCVALLCEAGAEAEAANGKGRVPLMLASAEGHAEVREAYAGRGRARARVCAARCLRLGVTAHTRAVLCGACARAFTPGRQCAPDRRPPPSC
eukprot:6564772-Prymnesium_polylepis.1